MTADQLGQIVDGRRMGMMSHDSLPRPGYGWHYWVHAATQTSII